MSGGIFVSEDCIGRLKPIFSDISADPHKHDRNLHSALFDSDASFDEFYTSLYAARLAATVVEGAIGKRYSDSSEFQFGYPVRRALQLDILSDIELIQNQKPNSFSESLLDEILVAEILNFRNAVISSLPLPARLAEIEFGCIYLKFNIFASPEVMAENNQLPGLSESRILDSEYCSSLFKRYKVKSFQLHEPR